MLCYTRNGTTITQGMVQYKCLMSMNMDQIIFAICLAPSTMSILLVIDGLETMRCFGTHEKALWNFMFKSIKYTMLYKERYKNYPRHEKVTTAKC